MLNNNICSYNLLFYVITFKRLWTLGQVSFALAIHFLPRGGVYHQPMLKSFML